MSTIGRRTLTPKIPPPLDQGVLAGDPDPCIESLGQVGEMDRGGPHATASGN